MLTKETLIANEALAGLTDEQITAITTLSANDENTVIGQKFGEVYRQMDSTIEKATGIKRDGDEKTYLYLERATRAFADKFSDYDTIKNRVSELEEQVAKGGDEGLKAQLAQAQAELNSTKNQFNTLKANFDKAKTDHAKALNDFKIEAEIAKAKEGLTFKKGLSEPVMNTLVAQAVANVKAKNPSFEDRNGVSTLVFHDANGAPLNNAENKLNPFTARELLVKEFESMDILETMPAKGAGGKPRVTAPSVSLSGVTTQVEATDVITKMLAEKGIAKTNLNYQAEYDKLWDENNCSALPLQ